MIFPILCPRDLFEIIPLGHHLLVQCKALLSGDEATELCAVACDACGRCASDAAPGLVHMENNLPLVDYSAGGPAKPEATYRCPTGAIKWVTGGQFSTKKSPPEAQSEKRYQSIQVPSARVLRNGLWAGFTGIFISSRGQYNRWGRLRQ